MVFLEIAVKSEWAEHTTDCYQSRNYLTSNHWHEIADLKLAAVKASGHSPVFVVKPDLWEENFERWNGRNWCQIVTISVPALGADSSQEVQLWRCGYDSWSRYVPLTAHLSFKQLTKKTPIAVLLPLVLVLSGPPLFRSILDMPQGSCSERGRSNLS